MDALPGEHPIKAGLYCAVRDGTAQLHHIREIDSVIAALGQRESISDAKLTGIDLGTGVASAELRLPRELFYKTLSEQSGFAVADDGDLMSLLTRLATVKAEYDKVAGALRDVRENGYGIVVPGIDELKLEEPEIMIDASGKPFAENIEITKRVVEYAHDHGVVVEAELGTLAGIEDDVKVKSEDSSYTHPEEVEEFVTKSGCDSLAIAIGTSHGAYKFKPGTKPQLRFDVLEEVSRRLPGFPIVLHGSSSVPQEFVEKINKFGGNMPGAIGVPEDQLRHVARSAYHKWISGKPSLRATENERLAEKIEQIHTESPDKGYRRINDDLNHDHGVHFNDKRVLRICRSRDIKSTIKYNNHGRTGSAP